MMRPPRPRFIVVGAQDDSGVILLASTTLSQVQLEAMVETVDAWGGQRARLDHRYTLDAEMRDITSVHAPTWQEAWDMLFATWAPTPQTQLHPPHRAIGVKHNE